VEFKDHFSSHASDYARFRPNYPTALFEFLASRVSQHHLVWDCGTGNGQAAHGLAAHFDVVIASDPSGEQIQNAMPHEKIRYRVASAENIDIPSQSVDLVTAAQAAHWFDMKRFSLEARRVLKPNGVLAVWCYGLTQINPELDEVVQHYYSSVVGAFWPPERHHIEAHYQTLHFPFAEQPSPAFHMQVDWDLNDFEGYLHTWSATQRYIKKNARHPIGLVHRSLLRAWGDASKKRPVRWPISLRIGTVSQREE